MKCGEFIICFRYNRDNNSDAITLGKQYKIIEIAGDMIGVYNNGGSLWWIESRTCRYKELISEIDYLNAFQQNFKEGI